jgi:TorA maturation chaperone TorD
METDMTISLLAKRDDWPDILFGEALLFNLLGKLLYSLPDRDWLQSLYTNEVFAEAPFAMNQPDVAEGLALISQWGQVPGGISAAMIQDLNVDNTRLFVGLGRVLAPLWESVYYSEERLVFQESTLDVRRWYLRFGLEPENLHKEPDDHIALEMAFIAHLASLGVNALDIGDREQCEKLVQAQHEFASAHLLRWAPLWCQHVIEHTRTDFYRGLAQVTRGALAGLAQLLELKLVEPVK